MDASTENPSYLGLAGHPLSSATSQVRQTEHTFKLEPGQKPAPASISDMAWLAGHWTGEALGGISEEIWSPPRNGVMMGMYRLVKESKPVFYKFLLLAEEAGSLVIRLKHFNPDLVGWEEKDQTVEFPFVTRAHDTAVKLPQRFGAGRSASTPGDALS